MVVYIDSLFTNRNCKNGTICYIAYDGSFHVKWEDGTKTFHPMSEAPTKPLQSNDLHPGQFTHATIPKPRAKCVDFSLSSTRKRNLEYPVDQKAHKHSKV
jgi:hypothetical protein